MLKDNPIFSGKEKKFEKNLFFDQEFGLKLGYNQKMVI